MPFQRMEAWHCGCPSTTDPVQQDFSVAWLASLLTAQNEFTIVIHFSKHGKVLTFIWLRCINSKPVKMLPSTVICSLW